ncbi:MAG: hypothetical protein PHF51_03875, partial [Candidatus ainarchaeum sp.]|nr:hypothetical protein [Candidatus ainarchaeum sp.]
MLKPAEMDKIRVIGLRKDMDAIVALIHDLGVVQFRKYADVRLSEEKPSEAYSAVSEQLVKLEALVAALKPRPVEGTSKVLPVEQLVSESGRLVSEVEPRLARARERLDELELELRDLTEVASILKGLKDFDMNLSVMESRELCFFMGRIPNSKIGELDAAISSVTDKHALKCRKTSSLESVCAVVAGRKSREQIAAALQKLAFAEARLPQIEGTPYAIGTDVGDKIRQLEKEKAALESEVGKLSDKHYAQAAILLEMLRIQADRLYAITNFSGTGYIFALEGWVPSSDCGRVEA